MKIGIIGAGNMGSAMIKGWLKSNQITPQEIYVKGGISNKTSLLQKELGFNLVKTYADLKVCDLIIIATKSTIAQKIVEELYIELEDTIIPIVSIAAQVTLHDLSSVTSTQYPLCISIPNLAVQVNKGILATVLSNDIDSNQKQMLLDTLSLLGEVVETNEEGLDIITAVAGCGPALVAIFMESISDSAVKYGLPRAMSYELIAQMLAGTSELVLENRIHPAILKDAVTTPKGITIKGTTALEDNGFRKAVHKAMDELMR